ncbi:MAG: mannose-6-phosphate isomerase, class I [Lachnospiraceae bacterium]|nr:mannose-6-phosphate isomerase, class I [Lachnospiraceae bacterium]
MEELIILEPEIKEMIWGWEFWTVSAHPNGDCRVREGKYKGLKLSELWRDHREVFGNAKGDVFPLLVKRIDAKDDLSIQVHPDDEYAKLHEDGSLGKTECWYVIDSKPEGSIIIGHNAKTKEELKEMIDNERWKDLLREIPTKKGDFFQIVPGTVHAIKNHTEIMEIQENSDITYRLYDYDRLKEGKRRELHIEKSLDVIKVPYKDPDKNTGGIKDRLVSCRYYTVDKRIIDGSASYEQDKPFKIISVIEGEGDIDGHRIRFGDSLIIPYGYGRYTINGNITVLITGI